MNETLFRLFFHSLSALWAAKRDFETNFVPQSPQASREKLNLIKQRLKREKLNGFYAFGDMHSKIAGSSLFIPLWFFACDKLAGKCKNC